MTVSWECITPLGRPVVPLVYMMNIRSSSEPTGTGSTSDWAANHSSYAITPSAGSPPAWIQCSIGVASPRPRSSPTSSANSAPKISTEVPESERMNSSSSATRRQFSGTTTPPALPTAKNDSTNSVEFISRSPTRSPLARSNPWSPLATRFERRLSSRYEKRRSLAVSTSASLSGSRWARRVSSSPMLTVMASSGSGLVRVRAVRRPI